MTYNVFSGTLSPTQSVSQLILGLRLPQCDSPSVICAQVIRSTPLSRPNDIREGLKCLSRGTSIRPQSFFSDFSGIWCIDRRSVTDARWYTVWPNPRSRSRVLECHQEESTVSPTRDSLKLTRRPASTDRTSRRQFQAGLRGDVRLLLMATWKARFRLRVCRN